MTKWVLIRALGGTQSIPDTYDFFDVLKAIAISDYNSFKGVDRFFDKPIKLFKDGQEIVFPTSVYEHARSYMSLHDELIHKAVDEAKAAYIIEGAIDDE